MPEAISLKFGMWSTEVGGNVHSKICLVSSRQHRATEVRKLRFLSSCQYTHGVARRLLGPHDTLPCVLICRGDIIFQRGPYIKHFCSGGSKYFDMFGPGGTKIGGGSKFFMTVPQEFMKIQTLLLTLQEQVNNAYTCTVASYHLNAMSLCASASD